jgi:hypothetical protein
MLYEQNGVFPSTDGPADRTLSQKYTDFLGEKGHHSERRDDLPIMGSSRIVKPDAKITRHAVCSEEARRCGCTQWVTATET